MTMGSRTLIIAAGMAVLSLEGCSSGHGRKARPNVLFICIDDLRREPGCYGTGLVTPNIDALAADGTLFCNQYVSAPTSGASRHGMLTGLYPRSGKDISNDASAMQISGRPETERPETMFHHLRRNGYYTVGIGKISHSADGYVYPYTAERSDILELPHSWDEMLFNPGKWKTGWNAFFGYSDGTDRQGMKKQVPPYEKAGGDDLCLPDGLTAELAVAKLKELAASDRPFCLAVGFFKPHLPFTAPARYWDLYDRDSVQVSPVADIPEGFDLRTLHQSNEFNGYLRGDEKVSLGSRVSDSYARKLRHAYYACVSYTDAQVGKVIDALKETGLYDNTIIVVWGDHGWHLGDYRIWGKHTLYETSLASCLVVRAPGYPSGIRNTRIVSSTDIYPTLMELCGVPAPEGLDGRSFAGLLSDPEDASWDDAAYSYFRRGISVRVPGERLTYYRMKDGEDWLELYSYGEDQMEHMNRAEQDRERADSLFNARLLDRTGRFSEIYD